MHHASTCHIIGMGFGEVVHDWYDAGSRSFTTLLSTTT
jgi:hypothetical protein